MRFISSVGVFCLMVISMNLNPSIASENKDLYLVKFKQIESQVKLTPDTAIDFLTGTILPALTKINTDKRVLAGGLILGDRAGLFIMKAGSHDEVAKFVRELPTWGIWS